MERYGEYMENGREYTELKEYMHLLMEAWSVVSDTVEHVRKIQKNNETNETPKEVLIARSLGLLDLESKISDNLELYKAQKSSAGLTYILFSTGPMHIALRDRLLIKAYFSPTEGDLAWLKPLEELCEKMRASVEANGYKVEEKEIFSEAPPLKRSPGDFPQEDLAHIPEVYDKVMAATGDENKDVVVDIKSFAFTDPEGRRINAADYFVFRRSDWAQYKRSQKVEL